VFGLTPCIGFSWFLFFLSCSNFCHKLKARVTTWMVIGWRKLKYLFN
jgi:hypothetical protein